MSKLWWLLPIFFTILGGVVAYVANRGTSPKTARHMLILGIVIIPLFIILVFASVAVVGLTYWLTG